LTARAQTPLRTVVYRYIDHRKKIDRLRQDSTTGFRITLLAFANSAGDIEIGAVSYRHVRRFIVAKTDDGVSDGTIRQYISRLNTFAQWAKLEKYTRRDFMRGIKPPRKPQCVPRSLTADEARLVLDACPTQRERLIATLMQQLGLRVGEVVKIRRCDVDLDGRLLFISGKGGKERQLPIVDALHVELQKYLIDYPAAMSDPLIRSLTTGKHLSRGYVSTVISRIMLDAGVKAAPRDGRSSHCFRHSLANDLLAADVDVRDVQEILGHAHASTTLNVYGRRARSLTRLWSALEGR